MSFKQLVLFENPERSAEIQQFLVALLNSQHQPSASELIALIEEKIGLEARWDLIDVIEHLAESPELTRSIRAYFKSLLEGNDFTKALRGKNAPEKEVVSSIDLLIEKSKSYRSSKAFQEMIDFVGRFRDYAPYNNMLVRIQNPSCSFYATEKDWGIRFRRVIKEDARPMLILAPMHPVMLVYDLDETEGEELPKNILEFARFEGDWDERWLKQLVKNARRHRILIQFKELSLTHGGFTTLSCPDNDWKMRVVVHDQLDEPSKFGVLCHELAHVLLGHLGSDWDHWWPARTNLSRAAVEVEAEAVAWIVTTRFGLSGASAAYVSGYLQSDEIPSSVSIDMIAKTAGLIERMSTSSIPPRRSRPRKEEK